MRRCTLVIDERDQKVYYPFTGAGGQVLAMNCIPTIEVRYNTTIIGNKLRLSCAKLRSS